MRECFQSGNMSMLDHGLDVRSWYVDLIRTMSGGVPSGRWRLPDWVRSVPTPSVDDRAVELYQVYHDCGKPLCRTVDPEGRQHFPDHAEVSRRRWLECSDGSPEALRVAGLIAMDMDVHLLRPDGVEEFARRPEAITLLLTGLAELHSNAGMFGGIESTGFKIKYKRLEKLGARIVKRIEEGK